MPDCIALVSVLTQSLVARLIEYLHASASPEQWAPLVGCLPSQGRNKTRSTFQLTAHGHLGHRIVARTGIVYRALVDSMSIAQMATIGPLLSHGFLGSLALLTISLFRLMRGSRMMSK